MTSNKTLCHLKLQKTDSNPSTDKLTNLGTCHIKIHPATKITIPLYSVRSCYKRVSYSIPSKVSIICTRLLKSTHSTKPKLHFQFHFHTPTSKIWLNLTAKINFIIPWANLRRRCRSYRVRARILRHRCRGRNIYACFLENFSNNPMFTLAQRPRRIQSNLKWQEQKHMLV